jgi:phosphatidylserine/phosphatidylglycerophosphate/cardiolipin synthase-like enzyme
MEVIARADDLGRFRIYTPITKESADIYVHAKVLIVDDQLIRVGSANFNNRSMGLDSECDLTIDTALDANASAREQISGILYDLVAEHTGVPAKELSEHVRRAGSLIAAIDQLAGPGRKLLRFQPEKPNKLERQLAEQEILDPENSANAFEPMARPSLLRGLRRALYRPGHLRA